MLKRFLIPVALAVATAQPVVAGGTFENPVHLDVLDGGVTSRGTYVAALRLTLADGWKTYWRAPGEAGIPPRFDWRGSDNVGNVAVTWPTPVVFELGGMKSIGYKHELVLPVEITPARANQPVRLSGQIEIGVCKDVCLPSTLDFDHRLDATAKRNPEIAAALAQRPYSKGEAGVRAATCRLTPSADGMRIEARIAMPTAGGKEFTVFEPGTPDLWATEAQSVRDGDVLVASSELVNDTGNAMAIDRSRIRITVLGRNHAVDIQGCSAG